MNFEKKILEIWKLRGYNVKFDIIKKLIEELNITDISTLEKEIKHNIILNEKFVKEFLGEIFYENCIQYVPSDDRFFLDGYNDKVKDFFNFFIIRNNEDLRCEYFEYENHKYMLNDFNIDDIFDIWNLIIYPPHPLIRIYVDNEDKEDTIIKINQIFNFCIGRRMNREKIKYKEDLLINPNNLMHNEKAVFTNGNKYVLMYKYILKDYDVLNNIINEYKGNHIININIIDDNAFLLFTEFLCTGSFDLKNIFDILTNESITELRRAADQYLIKDLVNICDLLCTDNKDLKKIEYIKKAFTKIDNFFNKFKYNYEDIKILKIFNIEIIKENIKKLKNAYKELNKKEFLEELEIIQEKIKDFNIRKKLKFNENFTNDEKIQFFLKNIGIYWLDLI